MSNEKTNYKETLNLPSTDFPMRANLGQREPDQVAAWERDGVYDEMIRRRREEGAERFIFHDGPPYANGHIHHGHILNKVLKDFVTKYRNMAGWLCEFVPGWDCHGLPIEHQVDKELGAKKREMSKVEIRRACREYAARFVDIQRDEFRRIMVFADWDDPYLTMSYGYEATTVRELGRIFERGLAYRGLKPVHWDWAAQTALAEAEVEYMAFTTEHVYVSFPFSDAPDSLTEAADDRPVNVMIWTTTPWTLPANLAIALHPELTYELVAHGGECFVVAQGLRDEVVAACGWEEHEVLTSFEGRELVGELGGGKGLRARHPFLERDSVLLPADYVTLDQGTGCVHTAPGHGAEDFHLGQQHGLDVLCPVDERGRFGDRAPQEWQGLQVFEANPKIVEHLHGLGRLHNRPGEKVTIDRYPHGWRSKKPVIFRATTQWFIAMDPENVPGGQADYSLRQRALEEIEEVDWVPRWGRERIVSMVEGRPDWCISRQRVWGVPITALHCRDCRDVLATRELAWHVASLMEEEGADAWFQRPIEELLPEGASCPGCGGTNFRKEQDILDVWFDSGSSWSAVLEDKLGWGEKADLYLEGSDQHRGWFQSSLMICLASRDHSPYDTCLTHGFVVDEQGHKYSKSSKNFEPPERMLQQYGAELLRLWVAAVDYRNDIALSPEVLKRTAIDAYRKIRNTFRFLLGSLDGFDPARDLVDLSELEDIDRWALHRTAQALERIDQAYQDYQFHLIYHTLVQLMGVDLSSVYLDVTKDRMYCEASDGPRRRGGQTAYWLILNALVRACAPILSFTAEEVWEHMPHGGEEAPGSVFLRDWDTGHEAWLDEALGDRWERLLEVRSHVQRALEAKRVPKKQKQPGQIGSSQEATVRLTADGATLEFLREHEERLAELFIVSQVVLVEGKADDEVGVDVEVEPSDQEKCPRCWNYWVAPEAAVEVCGRCADVLS